MADIPNVTERQAKYFASMGASLEKATGKSLAEWVGIARTCPETSHRARLTWFKTTHGLLQNRASHVLSEAFEPNSAWRDPDALIEALWTDAAARDIYQAIDTAALALPGALRTARKGYTAWSRTFQFAAARPVKGGVVLGLAIPPDSAAGLDTPRSEPWSERLKSRLAISTPGQVEDTLRARLEAAWQGS
ncbi:MAG TPA: DUF5655 domain-containing protein [Caulobacteraceae bacterium]|jgi:hypothetical protein|nr:DUF5655 domain-containing protein [Caulobacteraceae bacterium]